MNTSETVFMTGFPGFIAGRLLRRLVRDRFKFLLLVQPALVAQAREDLAKLEQLTGRNEGDFRILPGDITVPDLGLSESDRQIALNETTVLFHLAALYDLAVSRQLAVHVNLEGTRNVNLYAQASRNLRHYHYISTCYVAGKREGRILETELQHDAGFRNHYEETKYLAEIEVEELKKSLPVTIHRPAVVCGDSVTGETAKYDGVYYLINYILRWPAALSLFNIGNSTVRLNIVPVDFVVEALALLATDQRVIAKTLQIADPNPLTTEELFDVIARCAASRSSRLTIPAALVEFSLMLPLAPLVTRLPHHGVPYFFIKQNYDTVLSSKALGRHNVYCPSFVSYVEKIVDFAAHHPHLD
ncbi:MAG TPA: SDR family oxidoreductase [Pyrinomonadaceae bacterium]|nr:SDR family oxidoreductase [Pyrinomonadaceae bacterium]